MLVKAVYLSNDKHSDREGRGQIGNPDLIELGRNIQVWRERAGITQETLGLEIEADKAQISRYESGHTAMKVDRFFQIAEVLQVPVEELCPKWLCDRERLAPQWFQLTGMIEKLPEEKREILFQAVKAMVIGFHTVQ